MKRRQQRRSNIVECYKSNDYFDKVERSFDIVYGVDGNFSRTIEDRQVPAEV